MGRLTVRAQSTYYDKLQPSSERHRRRPSGRTPSQAGPGRLSILRLASIHAIDDARENLWLWTSETLTIGGRVAVALCVINQTSREFRYRLVGDIEEKGDQNWTTIASFAAAPASLGMLGGVSTRGSPPLNVKLVLHGSLPGTVGMMAYIGLEELEGSAGPFRLRCTAEEDGEERTPHILMSVIQIDAVRGIPIKLENSSGARLIAKPAVVLSTPATLKLDVWRPSVDGGTWVKARGLAGISLWGGTGWERLSPIEATKDGLKLPAQIRSGCYRLSLADPDLGEVTAPFWAAQSPRRLAVS